MTHRLDGPPPSQTSWWGTAGPKGRFAANHDAYSLLVDDETGEVADRLREREDAEELGTPTTSVIRRSDFEPHEARRAIEVLEQARQTDRTNPFYPLYLAEVHRAVGDEEAANEAYADAANRDEAVWQDLMWVSTKLEYEGTLGAAEQAFETGIDRLVEAGIERRRLRYMVDFTLTFFPRGADPEVAGEIDAPVPMALEAGETERVDAIIGRYAGVYPNLEGGSLTWYALGEWMDEQGADDRAGQWRERAESNLDETRSVEFAPGARLDVFALVWAGLTIVLFVFPIVIGLRFGLGRRTGELVDRSVTALAVLVLLIGVWVGLTFAINAQIEQIDAVTDVPRVVLGDGMASPEAGAWLETLSVSSARDELMAIHEREQEAFVNGDNIEGKEAHFELIASILASESSTSQWELMQTLEFPQPSLSPGGTSPETYHLGWALLWLIPLVVLSGLGWVIGRFVPVVGRWGLRLIPGGPRLFSPLGPLVLLAFATAIVAVMGSELTLAARGLDHFALHYYQGLYPLEIGLPESLQPSITWAMGVIALVVVVQAAMVVRALRGR